MADIFAQPQPLQEQIEAKRKGNKLYAQCADCKHYVRPFTCAAFEKIPPEILTGSFDHRQPYESDKGIQFEVPA